MEGFIIDYNNPETENPKELHKLLKSKEHEFKDRATPREDTIKRWLKLKSSAR